MYVKVKDGLVERYPYTPTDLIRQHPDTSFPAGALSEVFLARWGVYPVEESEPTDCNPLTHRVEEGMPFEEDGKWRRSWAIYIMSAQERAEAAAHLAEKLGSQLGRVLNEFAKTRGYDSMLSACTYAASAVDRFKREGQYCLGVRDAAWAALEQIMADAVAGKRRPPTDLQQIVGELPKLAWPE